MSFRHYFSLVDALARFALKADARRFYLGYLWWILEPLLYVAVFYLVFEVFLGTRQPDFLVFLAVGKLTFIWFSKSVNQAANSLDVNKGLIAQRDLPKTLFPMAVIQEGLYKQLAIFALLIAFLWLAGFGWNGHWLWLPVLMLLQYVLICCCGLAAALLVCLQRDFTMVVQLGTVFLLFMSGVFWDVNTLENPVAADWLLRINPLAYLLDAYRAVFMRAEAPSLELMGWLALELALVLVGLGLLYRRARFWIARRVMV